MGLLSFEALNGNNIPSRSAPRGLLGLGGFGGSQPPAGLLGPHYDPSEERRRKISGAMTQAGLTLLTNGKGSFGEVLGQGLAGAVQGANNAGINYKNDAMSYQQLEQQMAEQREKEEEKNRIADWVSSRPPEEQEWLAINPEAGAKMWQEQKFKSMYPDKEEGVTLSPGQVRFENGKMVYGVSQEPPKPTSGIQDYEYYKQTELSAGRQPLGPLEYEQSVRKSGATSINNISGSDGNFDKELSKGVAGVYTSAMEAGQNAVATKSAAQQLRVLMKGRGGSLDGLSAAAAPFLPPGLVPEGATDIVAAQAIIAGLVPKQRVPGSGTTSDFDAKKFAESLPSLWNKPGANEIITNTMESYADYQIAVSNVIADVASNPQIANKAAAIREQISQIPDPFGGWKQYMAASGSGSGGGKVIDGYTIRRVQ